MAIFPEQPGVTPLLSVILITYAQEKFLEQALKGVLSQKCNFPIEFIIANDASPDASDALIKRNIATDIPGISIKYILQDPNIGMAANYASALENTTGKYLAVCEGDDYWTDEFKLQKQVNFLESNPDYNSCFHDLDRFNESKQEFEPYYQLKNIENDLINLDGKTLAHNAIIGTCTYVCRNNLKEHAAFLSKCAIVDYPSFILSTDTKKTKFLQDKMAVYRIHDGGIWTANTNWKNTQNLIETLILLIEYPGVAAELKPILKENFYRSVCSCAFLLLIEDHIKEGVDVIKKYQMYDLNRYVVDHFLLELLEKKNNTKSYKISKKIAKVLSKIRP